MQVPVGAEELARWLESGKQLPPLVTKDDKGKEGTIADLGWVDTKYGRKLRISIRFASGEEKAILLSKTRAALFVDKLRKVDPSLAADPQRWIGLRVIVDTVFMNSPQKGVVETPVLFPVL